MDEGRDGVGARGARVPSWVPRLERRGGSRARGWMMLQRWLRARGLRAIEMMMETTSHASVGEIGARARRLSL